MNEIEEKQELKIKIEILKEEIQEKEDVLSSLIKELGEEE